MIPDALYLASLFQISVLLVLQTEVCSLLFCSIWHVLTWENLFVIKQWFQLCNAVFLLVQWQNLAVALSALWFICYRFVWWCSLSSQMLKNFMQLLKRVQGALSAEALLLRYSFPMDENEAVGNHEKRQLDWEICSIKATWMIIFNIFFMPSVHIISFNIIQIKIGAG